MRLKSRLLFSNTVIPQNKDVKFGNLTLQFIFSANIRLLFQTMNR